MPRALITGITGQDGLYLAQFLAAKNYDVYGLVRGQSNPKAALIKQLVPAVQLLEGDLSDFSSLLSAVEEADPDEVYNLGAITFVGLSWRQAELTGDVTGLGVLRLLEAIRIATGGDLGRVRFYQASSSEMFGVAGETPQRETTPLRPRSPYGVAKVYGHQITVNYRESYGAFACSGILFNHESPHRGYEFVTRKVTRAVARIALGLQDTVALGNLDVCRDWGFAGDYVDAMWRMLQQSGPADYVIATGRSRSIRDLLGVAFAKVGIDDWSRYVVSDPRLFRPADITELRGDAARARDRLDWAPRVDFSTMIAMMVDHDLAIESAASGRAVVAPRLSATAGE